LVEKWKGREHLEGRSVDGSITSEWFLNGKVCFGFSWLRIWISGVVLCKPSLSFELQEKERDWVFKNLGVVSLCIFIHSNELIPTRCSN